MDLADLWTSRCQQCPPGSGPNDSPSYYANIPTQAVQPPSVTRTRSDFFKRPAAGPEPSAALQADTHRKLPKSSQVGCWHTSQPVICPFPLIQMLTSVKVCPGDSWVRPLPHSLRGEGAAHCVYREPLAWSTKAETQKQSSGQGRLHLSSRQVDEDCVDCDRTKQAPPVPRSSWEARFPVPRCACDSCCVWLASLSEESKAPATERADLKALTSLWNENLGFQY